MNQINDLIKATENALVREAAGTTVIHAVGYGLGFVVSLVLARLLGAEQLGLYEFVFALIVLVGSPLGHSFNKLLTREVPRYTKNGQWPRLRGLLRWGFERGLAISALTVGAVGGVGYIAPGMIPAGGELTFFFGLLVLPLFVQFRVGQGGLRGLQWIGLASFPQHIVVHVTFLTLLFGYWWLAPEFLNSEGAIFGRAVAELMALVAVLVFLYRKLPAEFFEATEFEYRQSQWVYSAISLALMTGLYEINKFLDIILLGMFKPPDVVGVYAICAKLSFLVMFFFAVVKQVLGPEFSTAYEEKNFERLQMLATRGARASSLLVLPLVAVFLGAGFWVLGWFGPAFEVGWLSLGVLTVAFWVFTASGMTAYLLIMTDYQWIATWSYLGGATANIALNLVLIPEFGAEGAAVATLISSTGTEIIQIIAVRKKLGLDSTILGLRPAN